MELAYRNSSITSSSRAKENSPRRQPWEWDERLESPGTGRKICHERNSYAPSGG